MLLARRLDRRRRAVDADGVAAELRGEVPRVAAVAAADVQHPELRRGVRPQAGDGELREQARTVAPHLLVRRVPPLPVQGGLRHVRLGRSRRARRPSSRGRCSRLGQAAPRLQVLLGGPGGHLGRQLGTGRRLVPVERLEVVAHVLLVVARLALAGLVAVRRPEPRRVGRHGLVDEDQLAVEDAELELGVGDDDAALQGVGRAERVELQRRVAHLLRHLPADEVDGRLERDVLVVVADGGLGRRREERLREPAGLDEALRQVDPAHLAGLLVVLAPRPGEVAAHDGLHRQRLGPVHDHRPAGEVPVLRVGAERVRVHQVVGDDGVGLLEPEVGDLGEHGALVGDRRRQDDVEGGEAVADDDEHLVGRVLVDVAHLAPVDELPGGLVGLVHGGHDRGAPLARFDSYATRIAERRRLRPLASRR